jgi:uncharacterized membrane protein
MPSRLHLGRRIAPPRFVAFILLLAVALPFAIPALGWRQGIMASFDGAALLFLLSLRPLLQTTDAESMRRHAVANDANRPLMLVITAATMLAILVAVGSELVEKGSPKALAIGLIVATLVLAWSFVNTVYALHYAHIFYVQRGGGGDSGGLDFPDTRHPGYWDFLYFSFTLGMTFQTSDVQMTATSVRVVAIFQSLAAFVFNLGVLAFTINVLGSG